MKKRLFTSTLLALTAMFSLPLGAWGDDVIVTTQTLWQFDDSNINTEITSNGIGGTVTNVINGLYVKGDNSKKTTIATTASAKLGSTMKYTFHGTERSTSKYLNVQNGRDNGYSSISGLGTFLQAVHTGVPGTMYVCIACNSCKYAYIAFNGNSEGYHVDGAGRDKAEYFKVISREATEGGIFAIGANDAHRIAAIEFVPETVSKPSITVSEKVTVTNGSSNLTGDGNVTIKTYYRMGATASESFAVGGDGWTEVPNSGFTPSASGYVYAYSENTVTHTTSDVSVSTSSIEVASTNPTITFNSTLTGGSISIKNGSTEVASGSNIAPGTTLTLTATPNSGYQLKSWKSGEETLGSLPQSLVQTIAMPSSDLVVTAEFEAVPSLTPVSSETVWKFDDFAANTILSDKIVYGYNNGSGTLYISGHNSGGSNQATIKSDSNVSTEIAGNVSNYLYFYGNQNTELKHDRKANSLTPDAAAFKTGKAGIVSVYVKATSGKNINVYEAINTTTNSGSTLANKYTEATTGNGQLYRRYVVNDANVFVSSSADKTQFYAIKFEPETIGTPSISQDGNKVTITAGTSNASSYGATVSTYYTTDGTEPTTSSTPYTTPFDVTGTCTVKAITISNGGTSSTVASQECTFTPAVVNSAVTFESTVTGGSIAVMNGETSINSSESVASGTSLTVTVTPSDGYVFGSLSVTKTTSNENVETTQVGTDAKYTFTMPTEAVTIAATFNSIFGTEEVVSEETTWTFNDYSITTAQSQKKNTEAKDQTNKLYNRSASSGRGFIFKKLDNPINLTFGDNTVINVKQIANTPNTAKADVTDMNKKTAGAEGDNTTAFFAFNASVAGTCYAYVKNGEGGKCRIYFGKANEGFTPTNHESTSTDIKEIKLTSTGAGVFFIGGVTNEKEREIYAIRFVPTGTDLSGRVTLDLPVPTGGTVSVKAGASGSETPTDLRTFASGTSVVLTPTASESEGYVFMKWTDGNDKEITTGVVDPNTKALTMTLSSNQTVKAVFQKPSPNVTLTKNSDTYVLDNGMVSVTINSKGQVDAIKTSDNKDVMKTGTTDMGGLDYTADAFHDFSATSATVVKEGDDMVELQFTDGAWTLGYIMQKGVSGIYTYTYASVTGSSETAYKEIRMKWRPNASFNYAWVTDDVQGQMPDYARLVSGNAVQDATFSLSDGSIYTKYDWANYMKDDKVHGAIDQTNGVGAWVISPSTEWVNGGVQKQDLTVHADDKGPVLLQMMQSEHFGAVAHTVKSGEKKFFGPTLLYINTGSKADMISDAKAKAEAEVSAWPYSWFSNEQYPGSSARGTVTGTITLSKDDFTTTKLQVILADANAEDPLQQVGGYQYATEVESTNGSYAFTISNVRQGTYAVFAYALNGDATGLLKSDKTITVNAGSKDAGTIAWEPTNYPVKLWEIGEADHSTGGFKLSNHKRQYGLWDSSIVSDGGVPTDLTYTIGTSTPSTDWYYAQWKENKAATSTWTINFNSGKTYRNPLLLSIALASASRGVTLTAKINGTQIHSASYAKSDGSLYRSGVLSGAYGLLEIEVPASSIQKGDNTLTLTLTGGDDAVSGLMYDYIKLESQSEEAAVSETKNWTFGDLATGTTYKEVTAIDDEYYLRASTTTNRNFTVKSSAAQEFTFADGQKVTATNYLEANGGQVMKVNTANDAAIAGSNTAGDATNAGTPTFAFNTTKAGTVYAKISSNTAGKLLRVYFANGSSVISTGSTFKPSTTDITEISYTSNEAGTFFICGAEAAFKIYAVRFVPTDEAVKYKLTVGSADHGTLTVKAGSTVVKEGETAEIVPGSTLTLIAEPEAGYQFSGWKDGSDANLGEIAQSIMTKTEMTPAAMTVKGSFTAQPKTPTAVTTDKTWTFADFTENILLSGKTAPYEYNGLYISGHNNSEANQASIKSGTASGKLGDTNVSPTKYLSIVGGQDSNLAATRTVNSFTQDAVALKTGTTGTLYALMAGTVPTEGDRYFNIYVNGEKHQTKITSTDPVVVSQVITSDEANVFIATSGGMNSIYAIRFVPAEAKTVEIENGSEFAAIIEAGKAELTDVNITEETTSITISGTVDGAPVTSIAENAFTEENSEGLKAVDLSETQIALTGDVRAEGGILAALPEETLVYLPSTSSEATGTNVVIKEADGTYTCSDFQLFDEKSIEIPEGKEFTATDATLNRPFNMGKKCTVCLPYDFPATGGNFFEFTGISAEGKVQMTQRTGTLNSNTPYIFEPASDATAISAHSDTGSLEISISDAPETKNDAYHFTFKGTYDEVKWDTPQEDVVIYGFAAEARGSASIGQFVRGGIGASILPFRAYLEYNGTSRLSGVRARGSNNAPDYLEVEWIYAEGYGEVTRIASPEQQDAADAPTYNLRGQRVDDSYKGLIIKNGKVMVRK